MSKQACLRGCSGEGEAQAQAQAPGCLVKIPLLPNYHIRREERSGTRAMSKQAWLRGCRCRCDGEAQAPGCLVVAGGEVQPSKIKRGSGREKGAAARDSACPSNSNRCGAVQSLDILPEDALFNVLTLLPLCKIYELRLVCRAWNALLRSPSFLEEWSGPKGLLVMVKKVRNCPFGRLLVAFDVASGRWMSLLPLLLSPPLRPALSALGGPLLRDVANSYVDEYSSLSRFMAVGGAPGLVCFLCSPLIHSALNTHDCPNPHRSEEYDLSWAAYDSYQVLSVVVVNLFTGTHKVLPALPRILRDIFTTEIFLQPLPGGAYRVFFQERRPSLSGAFLIYESHTEAWKAAKPFCSKAKMAAACDLNKADFVHYEDSTACLYAYNVELDQWSQVLVEQVLWDSGFMTGLEVCPFGFPYDMRRGPMIFRNRGRILLVAGICKYGSVAGFVVWELRLRRSKPSRFAVPGVTPIADWVQVARTPEHMWKGVYSIDEEAFGNRIGKIIYSGDLICMTLCVYSGKQEYEGIYYPPLVYDIARDLWYHLPPYKGDYSFVAAFSMEPSFAATA